MVQRREGALVAIRPLAQPAVQPYRRRRLVGGEVDAVGIDQLRRMGDLAAQRQGEALPLRAEAGAR